MPSQPASTKPNDEKQTKQSTSPQQYDGTLGLRDDRPDPRYPETRFRGHDGLSVARQQECLKALQQEGAFSHVK